MESNPNIPVITEEQMDRVRAVFFGPQEPDGEAYDELVEVRADLAKLVEVVEDAISRTATYTD